VVLARRANRPQTALGDLLVDHIDPGPSLDGDDFFVTSPLATNIGTLSTDATIGSKELGVTASVTDDLANTRVRAGFRIRFATESSSSLHLVGFEDSENNGGSGQRPELVVVYRKP
jgi:hypothetical protein